MMTPNQPLQQLLLQLLQQQQLLQQPPLQQLQLLQQLHLPQVYILLLHNNSRLVLDFKFKNSKKS